MCRAGSSIGLYDLQVSRIWTLHCHKGAGMLTTVPSGCLIHMYDMYMYMCIYVFVCVYI